MTATDIKAPRGEQSVAKVTLSLALVQINGAIHSVDRADKDDDFHLACPACTTRHEFMKQGYYCRENKAHGPYTTGECMYGKMTADGTMKIFTQEAVKEARASVLPKGALALQVHPRADVEAATFPKGNVYVFIPAGPSEGYDALVTLIQKHRELIVLAKFNVRYHDHLVMVDWENGQLVIRELVWPEQRKDFADVEITAPAKKNLEMMETVMLGMNEPFNASDYTHEAKVRLAELVEETPAKGRKKATKSLGATDLESLLSASVGNLKKTKKAS